MEPLFGTEANVGMYNVGGDGGGIKHVWCLHV